MSDEETQLPGNREALDSQVRLDGQGEDPLIRALLSDDFVKSPDTQAAVIARALSKLLTGQQATDTQMSKLMERMDKYDQAASKFEGDQQAYLHELSEKADGLRLTGEAKDRFIAQEAARAKAAIDTAAAHNTVSKKQFEEHVRNLPKARLIATGQIIMVKGKPRLVPDEIRIKHLRWVLPPGVEVEVPSIVAERYKEIQRSRAETDERKDLLDADNMKKDTEVAAGMARISLKYGSGSEAFPIASSS